MDKTLLRISLISLLNLIANMALFPVIPPHIRSLGTSHFLIGLNNAMFAGIQVISGPVMGSWSDLKGRSSVSIIAALVAALSCVLIGLTSWLPMIMFGYMLLGIFEHTQILTKAMIGDHLPKEKLSEAYGTSGAIAALGVIIGPVIAGHIVDSGSNGFFYVCLFSAFLHLCNIGFVQTVKDKRPVQNTTMSLSSLKSEMFKIFKDFKNINWEIFWETFCLRFLISFSMTAFFAHQGFHIRTKYDLSQKSIGYYIAFLGILGALSVVALPLVKKLFYSNSTNQKSLKLMPPLFMLLSVSLICLNIAPTYTIFLLCSIPLSFSNASLMIISMETIVEKSTDTDRGVLTGASESMLGIGRFIAPLVTGMIADFVNETLVMAIPVVLAIAGGILSMKMLKQTTHSVKID